MPAVVDCGAAVRERSPLSPLLMTNGDDHFVSPRLVPEAAQARGRSASPGVSALLEEAHALLGDAASRVLSPALTNGGSRCPSPDLPEAVPHVTVQRGRSPGGGRRAGQGPGTTTTLAARQFRQFSLESSGSVLATTPNPKQQLLQPHPQQHQQQKPQRDPSPASTNGGERSISPAGKEP